MMGPAMPTKAQNPDLGEKQMEMIQKMNPEVKVRCIFF